jgi:hypothetical protein
MNKADVCGVVFGRVERDNLKLIFLAEGDNGN